MEGLRALAVDYDGTLARGPRPEAVVLRALGALRARGVRVVLVTGRILHELEGVFPDVRSHVDAIVAENGAVLAVGGAPPRLLAAPVAAELERALASRAVPVRHGDVLLATQATFATAVVEEVGRLGLDEQIVRNRSELMVLPAGVSKGSGICEALAELGVSHHSAIGLGDAENDHALLASCEIGVAVADAVPALKAHADYVLDAPGPDAVARFFDRIPDGERFAVPRRWHVTIGQRADGEPVRIPASQVNVLIAGGSGGGKSWAAGLLAEKLVHLGYSLCVLDPEGDHTHLGELRGVVTLGGASDPPAPAQLGRLLQHRLGSLVIDLSLLPGALRDDYMARALAALTEHRRTSGIPHWIVVDEAHAALGEATRDETAAYFAADQKGFCLVTYQPFALCDAALEKIDVVVLLPGSEAFARATFAHWPSAARERLDEALESLVQGHAIVCRPAGATLDVVHLAPRESAHVRHWHKYVLGHLAPWQHFQFRDDAGLTGRFATNVGDFQRELASAPANVVLHHVRARDFSAWIGGTLQDRRLARVIAGIEADVHGEDRPGIEPIRRRLLEAIEARYGEGAQPDEVPSAPTSDPCKPVGATCEGEASP